MAFSHDVNLSVPWSKTVCGIMKHKIGRFHPDKGGWGI